MDTNTLQHLLILCCYGGLPFIDYEKIGSNISTHHSSTPLDPTDWIAVDSSGTLLNDTLHPEILKQNPDLVKLIPPDTSLDQCDLYNLTFSSTNDQRFYQIEHGHLSCRCPLHKTGVACHLNQLLVKTDKLEIQKMSDPFSTYIVVSLLFMTAMVVAFMIMRGCFCDFFGGCKNPFKTPKYEEPDPIAISRCLQAVHEYEKKKNPESNRPLIPSISEGCAPYNDTVYHPEPRSHSPPPPYSSHENLQMIGRNTKL